MGQGLENFYQIYGFVNKGEYGSFSNSGDFFTSDASKINTPENEDHKDKRGMGININHGLAQRARLLRQIRNAGR